LKDVEGSVSQFSGSSFPDISQWIGEFEDCAATVEWNPLQLFVYAKQFLSGAAKKFGIKLFSAEVHRRLGKRQQHKG